MKTPDYSQPLTILTLQQKKKLKSRWGWIILLGYTLTCWSCTMLDRDNKVRYYKSIIVKQEAEIQRLKKINIQISWNNKQQREILAMDYPKAQYDFTPPLNFKGVY